MKQRWDSIEDRPCEIPHRTLCRDPGEFIEERENMTSHRNQTRAISGQLDAARIANKQSHLQGVLHIPNSPAQRRKGNTERLGSLSEAQSLRDGDKAPQVVDIWATMVHQIMIWDG
ncbi:hypothetical protein AWB85_07615 [Mycobacteroides immunogenum]|uniref:Uncharacterized protein n=1 Tax=Mycobacteroides immunogenum TaxID=83262 RepID=A0A179VB47_9MYCO|nr:hypothetical protein AWB85_07615 [Mycobacteroides immunogenum]